MNRKELLEKRRKVSMNIEELSAIRFDNNYKNKDKLKNELDKLKKKYNFYNEMLKSLKKEENK